MSSTGRHWRDHRVQRCEEKGYQFMPATWHCHSRDDSKARTEQTDVKHTFNVTLLYFSNYSFHTNIGYSFTYRIYIEFPTITAEVKHNAINKAIFNGNFLGSTLGFCTIRVILWPSFSWVTASVVVSPILLSWLWSGSKSVKAVASHPDTWQPLLSSWHLGGSD